MYKCEYCGKNVYEKFGSGRFCSRSCANGYNSKNQSEEAKRRKIEIGKNNLRPHPENLMQNKFTREERSIRMKEVMSDPVIRKKISDKMKGKTISEETRRKISESVKLSYIDGRNKGWQSRNKHSYAEDFWRSVLDNNGISYQQEYKVSRSSLGLPGGGCFFLDFLLPGNVDLEIDGKQHYLQERKEHDQFRDNLLIENGYTVYRIKYVNPKNSLRVKEDIDKFLSWYNELLI